MWSEAVRGKLMFFRRLSDLEDTVNQINVHLDIVQSEKLNNLYNEIAKIQRILQHHRCGEITGFVQRYVHPISWKLVCNLFLYKDGNEYIFENVDVINPTFEQGKMENLIYAKSEDGKKTYLLDLDLRISTLIELVRDEP